MRRIFELSTYRPGSTHFRRHSYFFVSVEDDSRQFNDITKFPGLRKKNSLQIDSNHDKIVQQIHNWIFSRDFFTAFFSPVATTRWRRPWKKQHIKEKTSKWLESKFFQVLWTVFKKIIFSRATKVPNKNYRSCSCLFFWLLMTLKSKNLQVLWHEFLLSWIIKKKFVQVGYFSWTKRTIFWIKEGKFLGQKYKKGQFSWLRGHFFGPEGGSIFLSERDHHFFATSSSCRRFPAIFCFSILDRGNSSQQWSPISLFVNIAAWQPLRDTFQQFGRWISSLFFQDFVVGSSHQ